MNNERKAALITALLVVMVVGIAVSDIVAAIVGGLVLVLLAAGIIWVIYEAVLMVVEGL
jgi:hypothetical protein